MAPPKGARATAAQELSFEDTSTITKQKLAVQAQMSARGRRNGAAAAAAAANGHSLKDLASASETVSQATGTTPAAPVGVRYFLTLNP
jgi:hypothetical protein